MTDHPLTEARAEGLWNANPDVHWVWGTLTSSLQADVLDAMRTAHDLGRAATTQAPAEPYARTVFGVPDAYGTPHHDVDAIRSGDFVVEVDKDGTTRSGVVSERDCDGDWYDERGDLLVWADSRADHPDAVTVWTAPPAKEVALPTEFGTIITDVEVDFGTTVRLDSMVWTGLRWTYKNYSTIAEDVVAFTLPDGTRAIRDGQYEDGTPRFIKETTQ